MMKEQTSVPPPEAPQGQDHLSPGDRRHETRDVNVRPMIWIAMGLILGAVLTHAGLWSFLKVLAIYEPLGRTELRPPADVRPLMPPEPRLQVDEEAELRRIHAIEDAHLSSYGWVDKQSGVVRIPISKAMELIAQRGPPDWSAHKLNAK